MLLLLITHIACRYVTFSYCEGFRCNLGRKSHFSQFVYYFFVPAAPVWVISGQRNNTFNTVRLCLCIYIKCSVLRHPSFFVCCSESGAVIYVHTLAGQPNIQGSPGWCFPFKAHSQHLKLASHHVKDSHHQYESGGRHGEDQSQPGVIGDDDARRSRKPGKRAEGALPPLLWRQRGNRS